MRRLGRGVGGIGDVGGREGWEAGVCIAESRKGVTYVEMYTVATREYIWKQN